MICFTSQERMVPHGQSFQIVGRRPATRLKDKIGKLFRLLERHDPATARHCLRVRRYALRLAEALGLNRRQKRRLSVAALLHDLGKIGLPTSLLNKPGRLTDKETRLMRAHPALGEDLLASTISNPAVLAAIRGHHERFDGTGYPDGLYRQQTPLLARILAIADCFDAMTSHRPYQAKMSKKAALRKIQQAAGTQFDPALVRVFAQAIVPQRTLALSA